MVAAVGYYTYPLTPKWRHSVQRPGTFLCYEHAKQDVNARQRKTKERREGLDLDLQDTYTGGTNHNNNNSHSNSTHAATVLCSTPQDVPPALPKLLSVVHVEKLDTGSASVGRPRDDREPPDNANPSRMADPSPGRTGSMMLELMLKPTVMR